MPLQSQSRELRVVDGKMPAAGAVQANIDVLFFRFVKHLVVGVNYFCRLTTIRIAGSLLSVFDCSGCPDGAAGRPQCGSWAH